MPGSLACFWRLYYSGSGWRCLCGDALGPTDRGTHAELAMNSCIESGSSLAYQRLDEAVERLAPAVTALLQRSAPDGAVVTEGEEFGLRSVVPVRFPDGIGRGDVVARVFRYRDYLRVDVEIVHNRMFARKDGGPSERRCYLNDFVASLSLAADATALTPEFERSVLRGIAGAREGVQRHNREQAAPWGQVTVAAAMD